MHSKRRFSFFSSNQLNQPSQRNWFVEDTHDEALIARDMMERLGISSAILVSSPYHMRRIRIIAAQVFHQKASSAPDAKASSCPPFAKEGKGGFEFISVPTRYETPNDGFWLFNNYDRKFVLTEYMKIGWFLLYSPFV